MHLPCAARESTNKTGEDRDTKKRCLSPSKSSPREEDGVVHEELKVKTHKCPFLCCRQQVYTRGQLLDRCWSSMLNGGSKKRLRMKNWQGDGDERQVRYQHQAGRYQQSTEEEEGGFSGRYLGGENNKQLKEGKV